ncbi:hypothetical protein MFLAVUS_000006 [Mucor flavus]|uniref:Uncharacterized protein n=1 Tax=Mucor flavus TaxID=439312 RepID=A0ABP9YIH4_9FUNG
MAELSLYSPKIIYKKGVEQIVPDSLSRRDGRDCIPNEKSFEPRYLYDSPDVCALAISEKTSSFNDMLIADPVQDWPLYYFKNEDSWPETFKKELLKNQHLYVVKDHHVWRKITNKLDTNKDEKLVKFIPFRRRADLVEDFHRGFGHQGKTTVQQLRNVLHENKLLNKL